MKTKLNGSDFKESEDRTDVTENIPPWKQIKILWCWSRFRMHSSASQAVLEDDSSSKTYNLMFARYLRCFKDNIAEFDE
ncbi:hypothetical protein TNCV_2021371 [Trichonephila clavipes]|nr:hypothetical protein TNCV_2021371 [Trichonephila clavipes]